MGAQQNRCPMLQAITDRWQAGGNPDVVRDGASFHRDIEIAPHQYSFAHQVDVADGFLAQGHAAILQAGDRRSGFVTKLTKPSNFQRCARIAECEGGFRHSERIMKRFIVVAAALSAAAFSQATLWNVSANMDMAQHGLSGPATGLMTGTYDDVTNVWTVASITGTNLSGAPTNSHIHLGILGQNGGVIVPIGSSYSLSGSTYTYTGPNALNVPEANEAAFLSQGTYLNIHTAQNAAGEIRGQVVATAVPEPATITILAAAGLAALRRRKR